MNGSHAEILDDVAVYALGSLAPADAERVRSHIETCAECRAEYEALTATVAAVGRSAEACSDAVNGAVYASPLLKARIMREVRAEAAGATKPAVARRPSTAQWAAYALAAACVIIALSLGAMNLSLRREVSHLETAHTVPALGANVDERTLADLIDEKAKRYVVPGGEVVRAHDRLYITMHDMPPPPKGKVYQAWTLPKGSKTMVPNATFVPDRHGVAILALGVDARATHAVAVSVEPRGGSKAPTSSPVVLELLE